MYLPDHFAEKNLIKLHQHIQQHPFGMLVTHGHNGLDVNHLPFYLNVTSESTAVLTAHVALANPICNNVNNDEDVLVVFKTADHYISPNWYPSKHETQEQVPTWNYIVVHAHGKIKFKTDEKFLRGVLANLTKQQETQQEKPWAMGEAPKDYMNTLLKAIVGIEIEVEKLIGKSKLGQDEISKDVVGAAQALEKQGEKIISTAMLEALAKRS